MICPAKARGGAPLPSFPKRRRSVSTARLNDAVWQGSSRVSRFSVNASPNDGAAADLRNRGPSIASDATSLYIAVQAFESRSRPHCRDPHPPRRGIAIRLGERADRFLSRSPLGVRIRGQSRRGEAGQLLVQRQPIRNDGMGCGVGCCCLTRRARLARRVSHSVLAAPRYRPFPTHIDVQTLQSCARSGG